jgi:integrase
MKFTERSIAKLKAPDPSGKQVIHWDDRTRGFGILVSGTTTTRSYIAQRKLPDGRTRRVTIERVGGISLEQAREEATDLLHRIRTGDDPKARRAEAMWTLRHALDTYLKARTALRPESVRCYRHWVEHHLTAWLDLPLIAISPELVEERHATIQKEVESSPRAQLARESGAYIQVSGRATADVAMRAFRAVWTFAGDRLPSLPACPTRRLRRVWFGTRRRERLVTADQLPAFHRAITELPNPVQRDFLLLLLFTGMRRGEAASLQWTDIDFAARLIRLPAARTKAGRKLDLPMSDLVRDLLVARRNAGTGGPWVFPSSSRSGHLEESHFPLQLVAQATGSHVSAHDLRRTFITIAESTDISPLALKALVNHSLGTDVTSGYVIATVERLREPAQRVADRLKALCGVSHAQGANVEKLRS